MPGGGTAPLISLAGIAGLLETVGGTLILLGWFTRPVSFVLSGEMAVAYFYGHAPQGFWPVVNQGTPAILFCFLFLYLSSAGAGAWSIDAVIDQRSHRLPPSSSTRSVSDEVRPGREVGVARPSA